jgi:WD40 repeat protein
MPAVLNANSAAAAALEPGKTWVQKSLSHGRELSCCRFSRCGQFVFAGGLDNSVQRWNLETDQKTTLAGHTSWVSDLETQPGGDRLVSADLHGNVLGWSIKGEAPQPVWAIRPAHRGWVRAVVMSRDGQSFFTGGNDNLVKMWSTADGKPIREFSGHKGYVFSVAVHPDGKTLVSGDLFGVIKQWDIASGQCVRDLDAAALHSRGEDFIADVGGVRRIAFNPSGTLLACSGLADIKSNTFCPGTPCVLVLDWSSGKQTQRMRVKEKIDGYVNGLRFLDDQTLAGFGEAMGDAALWFWKPDAPEPFHAVKGESGFDLDLHPDGVRLAAALMVKQGKAEGNGRNAKREDYLPNSGVVRLYAVYAEPPKAAT